MVKDNRRTSFRVALIKIANKAAASFAESSDFRIEMNNTAASKCIIIVSYCQSLSSISKNINNDPRVSQCLDTDALRLGVQKIKEILIPPLQLDETASCLVY